MTTPLPPLTPATLYLVSTPIGNLEDITLRALRTLKECDVVAAEDTRRLRRLAHALDVEIAGRVVSYFDGNEVARTPELVQALESGQRVLDCATHRSAAAPHHVPEHRASGRHVSGRQRAGDSRLR